MFQGAAMLRTALRPEPFHAPLEHYLHTKGIHIGRDGSVIRVGEGIYDIMHRRFSRAIDFVDSDFDRGIGMFGLHLIGHLLSHCTGEWDMDLLEPTP